MAVKLEDICVGDLVVVLEAVARKYLEHVFTVLDVPQDPEVCVGLAKPSFENGRRIQFHARDLGRPPIEPGSWVRRRNRVNNPRNDEPMLLKSLHDGNNVWFYDHSDGEESWISADLVYPIAPPSEPAGEPVGATEVGWLSAQIESLTTEADFLRGEVSRVEDEKGITVSDCNRTIKLALEQRDLAVKERDEVWRALWTAETDRDLERGLAKEVEKEVANLKTDFTAMHYERALAKKEAADAESAYKNAEEEKRSTVGAYKRVQQELEAEVLMLRRQQGDSKSQIVM